MNSRNKLQSQDHDNHYLKNQVNSKPIERFEFRPPNNQDFQIINNMTKTSLKSTSENEKSDPLQRLEVETASSTSLAISFPYYYIDSEANSLTSTNREKKRLLVQQTPSHTNSQSQSHSHSQSPHGNGDNRTNTGNEVFYSNISHTPIPAVPDKDIRSSQDFNSHVPKRFSQFVRDRDVPKYNNGSDTTSSLGSESDGPLRRKSRSTLGMGGHKRNSSSPLRSNSSKILLNRQISESMGSQATIFSTRLEGEHNKQRSGANNHKTFGKSSNNSLNRRKAIRFKEGGIFYRIRLRLKKWLNNLKKFRFRRKVSTKGTNSNSLNRLRSKSKTLKRKLRSNSKNPSIKNIMNISAPINNPTLGNNGVQRVKALDDDLKYKAGAPMENVNLLDEAKKDQDQDLYQNQNSKLNHLDDYIGQQQGLYLNDLDSKTTSINYGRDKDKSNQQLQNLQSRNGNKQQVPTTTTSQSIHGSKAPSSHKRNTSSKNKIDEIEEIPLSEYSGSSAPPPPPKHGDETVISDYNDMIELWRKYLVQVLYKRIQLRQEISLFQSMIVTQDFKARKLSIGSALNNIYNIQEFSDKDGGDILETGTVSSSYETISDTEEYEEEQEEDITPKAVSQEKFELVDVEVDDDEVKTQIDDDELPEVDDDLDFGSGTSITGTESETASETPKIVHRFVPDANDERFNRRYANRQSVLGEMLDYSSDDELTITSLSSSSNHTSSIKDDFDINKQYSIKQKNLSRSLSSMSSNNANTSPIRRSTGYQLALNLAN